MWKLRTENEQKLRGRALQYLSFNF